jgi:hypothetical protein
MESLKVKLMVVAVVGLLVGAGVIFSCGKAKEALTTPPADQTKIAQEASAEAIGIATQVTDMAMLFMQGGIAIGFFAPKSPKFQTMAKELDLHSNFTCPRGFSLDIAPDGCDPKLDPYENESCTSAEATWDYAEGCTEALVWKEGESSIALAVIDEFDLPTGTDAGFTVTVSFDEFLEGSQPLKNGELIFTAASSTDKLKGELKIETGDSGYTEDSKEIIGYALMTYSANGTISVVSKNKATEANLTMEADITSTKAITESIDVKYIIVSDMSEQPGNPEAATTTVDISGTSSKWGSLDIAQGSIQLMAQDLTIDPACVKNPVGGTLGVKGTDENGVKYDVLLTFHETCDGKAEAKITVEGEDVSGTYEGTIPLQSTGPAPEESILGQLFQGFTDTFSGIQNGLEQL